MTTLLPATFAPDVTNRAFIDSAADMGARARADGRPLDSNPFMPDSPVFDAFAYGWNLEPTPPAVAPSEFGPYALSDESRADLADLAASDSPHAADLARNIGEWLAGRDYAPPAVIASARLLESNAELNRTAGRSARDMLAKLATDAANVAGSMNGDALRASDCYAAGDMARAMDRLADGLARADYLAAYSGLCQLLANGRKLSDNLAESKRGHATCAASLAAADGRLRDVGQAAALSQADAAAYREQRDSEGARAEAYKAAWQRLAREVSGVTLGQLPADSYGSAIAAAFLAGKRDLAELGH